MHAVVVHNRVVDAGSVAFPFLVMVPAISVIIR